jgi:hypothetical protein
VNLFVALVGNNIHLLQLATMRILLLFIFIFCCLNLQAQVRLGVQAGYSRVQWHSVNSAPGPFSDYSYANSGQSGFQAGIVAEVKLSYKFFLRPSLFASEKGTTLNYHNWYNSDSRGIWVRYIELPLTIVYQKHLSNKLKGFAGGGGYAAYGYVGVERGKGEGKDLSNQYTVQYSIYDRVELSNHNEHNQTLPTIVKPFDFGFTFLAGIERKSIQLLITYCQGVKPLLPNSEPYSGNYVNSAFTISVAYLINSKCIKQLFQ